MAHNKVLVQWRKGEAGTGGTYTFYPKPTLTRVSPGQRTAIHVIPLLDGAIVQGLGLSAREIIIQGVLFSKTQNWDDMETLRNNLINGIGTGPGQLHIISPSRHLKYIGQVNPDGIAFESQVRSTLQDYTITVFIPSGEEVNEPPTEFTETIISDAEIA